jgi:phage shock protein PspC (stress-responsive transcriptional regulator)
MQVNRRLYRCSHDRRLAGVASGLAEFFDLDPTLVRVLWFVSIFVTGGLSILVYGGLALIVPLEPVGSLAPDAAAAVGTEPVTAGHRHVSRDTGRFTTLLGFALILLGGLALMNALLPDWTDSWRYLWPLFFVGIGIALVVGAVRREPADS